MLLVKEHHEKSLAETEEEPAAEDMDVTAEYAPALTLGGNGNGWKQA
jgi:hypothetical protein